MSCAVNKLFGLVIMVTMADNLLIISSVVVSAYPSIIANLYLASLNIS